MSWSSKNLGRAIALRYYGEERRVVTEGFVGFVHIVCPGEEPPRDKEKIKL
jgi:hypothetical protein